MKPGSLIQMDWYASPEGSEIVKVLLHPDSYKRRQYGFLEKPNVPPHIEEVNYKIYVCGTKAGIGKTSTINRLAGLDSSFGSMYHETTGINVTSVYWPVKLVHTSKVMMFRLEFWDASEITQKKFGHVIPSCKEEMSAAMFLFSFTDKSSFDAIPDQMNKVFAQMDNICSIIAGTRYDMSTVVDVTSREVREFEQQFKVPIIRIKNVFHENQSKALQKAEFGEVALALNIICEQLCSSYQQT